MSFRRLMKKRDTFCCRVCELFPPIQRCRDKPLAYFFKLLSNFTSTIGHSKGGSRRICLYEIMGPLLYASKPRRRCLQVLLPAMRKGSFMSLTVGYGMPNSRNLKLIRKGILLRSLPDYDQLSYSGSKLLYARAITIRILDSGSRPY